MALAAAFFFIAGVPHNPLKHPYIYVREAALTAPANEEATDASPASASTAEVAQLADQEANLSPSDLINRWQPFIHEASQRFSVPENWIRAVIRIESGGRTTMLGRPITSGAGAMGVMQLMRDTYNEMRDQHDLGPNPYNVRDNILAGTAYLRILYDRYGYPFFFAAYNAGPGRLDAHLRRGRTLPAETRAYIKGAVRVVAETCAEKKKSLLTALAKLSPIQPAMAAEGCVKAKL
jgi:soluble lytic murein transglycosylase-like protein